MAVVASDAIRVEGLKEFLARVKQLEVETPTKVVRQALNKAAEIVAVGARARAPVKTGALRASIRASSTSAYSRVSEGNSGVEYAGATDYGNKRHSGGGVGRGDSGGLPFISTGRILYPAYRSLQSEVVAAMDKSLVEAARRVGLAVNE